MPLSLLDSQTGTLHPGDQPIPGFRLIRRRGHGGFGEVWEAEAAGGFLVALKFVRLSSRARSAELRALDFVRGIHHPNLLANFGSWVVDDTLIIGMELADQSLWDRHLEATQQGYRGIPRGELLGYLGEVAAGIDHLNGYHHTFEGRTSLGVQHRDLKPPNILLFGGGAKVADLGMARVMEGEVAGHTGVWTYSYAAPEFFRGETTRQSDQYGLAVTYCQLRGGQLPFSGSAASVTAGHLFAPPNLDDLPEPEQPVVARALAKVPGDRWPNCRAFVAALRAIPADHVAEILIDPGGLPGVAGDFPAPGGSQTDFPGGFDPSGSGSMPAGWLADATGSASVVVAGLAIQKHSAPGSQAHGTDSTPTQVLPALTDPPPIPRSLAAGRRSHWLIQSVGPGVAALLVLGASIAQAPGLHARLPATAPQIAILKPAPPPTPAEPTSAGPAAGLRPEIVSLPTGSARIDLGGLDLAPIPEQGATVLAVEAVPAAQPEAELAQPTEPARASVPDMAPLADRVGPEPNRAAPPDPTPTTPALSRDLTLTRVSVPERVLPPPAPAAPTAEAAFARGRDLFRQRSFAAAADAFGESIRLNPGHVTSFLLRAIARHRAGDPRAALADYDAVLRARPDDVTAFVSRGQAYNELGEYDHAIADYTAALGRRPGDGDAHFRRGLAHFKAGNHAGAIADFTATLQLDGTNAYAAELRAEAIARRDARSAQAAALTRPRVAVPTPGGGPATVPAATSPASQPGVTPATRERRLPLIRRVLPGPVAPAR